MPAQPQDRKPAKGEDFRFADSAGKSHTLPNVTIGRAKLTGRALRDAALGGDLGQVAYLIKCLEASGAKESALNALYDMPQDEMMTVLSEWGDHGDGDGASLGE